jgi:hypothetical protein
MKSNQKNLGVIKSSNLCVSPETFILTDKGCFQIKELEGQCVNVWNGEKWSNTTILKTGQAQKLVTVHLSNGAQITCTPYHKFIIRKDYYDKLPLKDATRVDASNCREILLKILFILIHMVFFAEMELIIKIRQVILEKDFPFIL